MPPSNLLFLDVDFSSQMKYLAEGAANVVYRVILPPPSPTLSSSLDFENDDERPTTPPPSEIPPLRLDPRLEGQLIRLRKTLPAAVPVIDSQTHFDSVIRPLFPGENLVERTLFRPSPDLMRECNRRLQQMETDGSRARTRHGVYLVENEIYGTLITDMTCGKDDESTSVEFKPKWLVQSPSAPTGAKRCRTCALNAMRFSQRGHVGEPEHMKSAFCPLSLVSGDKNRVAGAADVILGLSGTTGGDDEPMRQRLIEFLLETPLLPRLKVLQMDLDPIGVLTADVSAHGFLTAMTIRDCTLFLKVWFENILAQVYDHFPSFNDTLSASTELDHPSHPRSFLMINVFLQIPRHRALPIEARLGDLDLKTSSGPKAEYWRSVEKQLIDGGWYMGTEQGGEEHGRNTCQLGFG